MILFQPEGLTYINKSGENVLEAARNAGLWMDSPCGGNGSCGKCKVKVLVGEVNEVTSQEQVFFTQEELREGWRLACKLVPKQFYRSIEVEREVLEEEMQASQKHGGSYTNQKEELEQWQQAIGNIEVSDVGYGISVDIGTTNMEALLWNMKEGSCEARVVEANPQQSYGADVVSRLTYASGGEDRFEKLCQVLIDGVAEMIKRVAGELVSQVARVVIVANGVMMHFLQRESIEGMTKAPFEAACREWRELKGDFLGIPEATVCMLPNVRGFVGADLLGVLLYLKEKQMLEDCLVLDIGTNGELAVVKDGAIYVASTAAGPAFEGASISCGMRGEKGAIQGVTIAEEISFDVIGNGSMKGICGSGLVALVSELRRVGAIADTGYLLNGQEARNAGCPECVVARIKAGVSGNVFVCDEKVVLTQKDIRELQLAKAAVYTGCQMLLETCNMTVGDISHVYLAGAFGKYLDLDASKRIGLLPQLSNERIQTVGNAALLGATEVLFGPSRVDLEAVLKECKHISLAEKADFEKAYVSHMNL